MSYQKYQTDALVLSAAPFGEADKMFVLYTSEFGLVRARAVGVRNERSKMRMALQSASRAHVALVRGKRGWRLAGAHAEVGAYGNSAQGARAFARLALLVERLVVPEERNTELFCLVGEAHAALLNTEKKQNGVVELLCAARLLYALGYLSSEGFETALFTSSLLDPLHLMEAEKKQQMLRISVNQAIAETQL